MSERRIEHLGDLKPDPANVRRHNPRNIGMIQDALHEVGAARSIVIDEDGLILAGNGVVEAAAQAGIERVQVVDADGETIIAVRRKGLTAAQKKRLAVFDNRTAELADWDAEALAALVAENAKALEGMFTGDELAALMEGLGKPEAGEDPGAQIDRAAELQEHWQTAAGQLWEIPSLSVPGKAHRLLCGDSTRAEDVARLMGGERAGLLLTDPPYGISVVKGLGATDGGSKPVTIGTVRSPRPYAFGGVRAMRGTVGAAHLVDATAYRPVIGDDKPFDPAHLLGVADNAIIFGGNYFASKLPDSRCWIVWDKNNTGNFADAELAWTDFDKSVRLYHYTWNGLVREGSRALEGKNRMHPTQKPVGLFGMILQDFSAVGASVLDLYLGSGTTVVACETAQRVGYGMEIDPAYLGVVLQRLADMGLGPVKVSDG